MPGTVCSLSFSSCSLNVEAVVSALKLWTMGSCVPGHRLWLEEEDTQWKGDEPSGRAGLGVFIL